VSELTQRLAVADGHLRASAPCCVDEHGGFQVDLTAPFWVSRRCRCDAEVCCRGAVGGHARTEQDAALAVNSGSQPQPYVGIWAMNCRNEIEQSNENFFI